MKVLMFGWEFPPHISGGLGTACHGLVNSLSQENIDVLFVVPKLHGGETADHTRFINASAVPISRESTVKQYISPSAGDAEIRKALFEVIEKQSGVQTIEVPSTLSAYRSPSFEEGSSAIEHWNHSFETQKERDTTPQRMTQLDETQEEKKEETQTTETVYPFSGAYGPNLMEEVNRYAQVAAVIASQFEFDVIHAHDWMTYLAGIAAKKVSGKPLVAHVHATEYDRSGEYADPQVRAIEYQGMAEADCVVTVSNWTKKIAVSLYDVPEEKVEVVHNGITPRAQTAAKLSFRLPTASHIVTFLGRITYQKGPLYFVEAARHVLDRFPDAHFVVAGSGDQLPLMIERIAQLRMSSHFHFTGFLRGKDIEKVWSMSNVYVMPSVSEPFGIAPLEAIQAGVPTIISNQSGVAEVMPHAMKVDFWNSRELANAICSVLKYKSLSNTLSRNGAEEIGGITWDSAAQKLNRLYHGLTLQPQTNA